MRLILLTLVLLNCTTLYSAELSEKDKLVHTKCIYPTVRILNDVGYGSGVITRSAKMSDGYGNVVLTCAHVVGKSKKVSIEYGNYKEWSTLDTVDEYDATVFFVDEKYDLALLFFESDDRLNTAEIAMNEKLYITTQLEAVGYGISQLPRIDDGRITFIVGDHLYITSCFTLRGDSGSPVYFDNKVIGYRTAIAGSDKHEYNKLNMMMSVDVILVLSKKYSNVLDFVFDTTKPLPEILSDIHAIYQD